MTVVERCHIVAVRTRVGRGGTVDARAVRGECRAYGVDDDGVFVEVLRRVEECGGGAHVLGEVRAARGRAGEGVGDEAAVLAGDEEFGARAEERAAGGAGHGEGVAAGVAAGEAAEHEGQSGGGAPGEFEGAGEDDLRELARAQPLDGRVDGAGVRVGGGYLAQLPAAGRGRCGGA
ncbi:hypothetical protein GA0115246_106311, partial [Streptomyces sp. SolWspMP-sol7th]